ncbi:MAG: LytTR family DNA-binding domain-containing protein [Eubacteriales bacterium]|nr:LytTR family DNA-binding domain-containing protein [Eubacteriales bacterium]
MKIRIELDSVDEDEITIRCKELTPEIMRLQQLISETTSRTSQFVLYKGDTEYYIELDKILFFETENSMVLAHTVDNVYETRKKLYELEEMLPAAFLRISKSSIVNTSKIYSISRNLTASSAIEFQGTHKQIYVSRAYYKVLKSKLEEKRYEQ